MSTKIYTGFKIETTNLPRILKLLEEPKQKMRKLAQEKFQTERADIIARIIDAATLGNTNAPLSTHSAEELKKQRWLNIHPMAEAYAIYLESSSRNRREETRDPIWDFNAEFCIIPLNSKASLGMLFAEQREYYEILKHSDGIWEYGYWNNSDKPEHIAPHKWEQRHLDWNIALPGNDAPATVGFTHSLFGQYDPVSSPSNEQDIAHFVPSLERRAMYQAKNSVLGAWMDAHPSVPFHEVSNFLCGEECQSLSEAKAYEITPKLLPLLTDEDAKKEWTLTLNEEGK